MQFLKKSMLFLLLILILTACSSRAETVDKQLLIDNYYDLLAITDQLFMNHAYIDGSFVNQSFRTEEEVKELLQGKVTENGIEQIIDAIFDKQGELLVYKEQYRDYLENLQKYSSDSDNMTLYYSTVRETILNPALQLVYEEQLSFLNKGKELEIRGENIPVTFYSQDGSLNKQQFKRYGYPPKDQVSMSFSFVYDNGLFLMDHYEVEVVDG